MAIYTAPLDLGDRLAAPSACPGCGAEPLRAVVDDERTNFLCRSCGRCWHQELSRTSEVDPHACGAEHEAGLRLADGPR